MIRDQDALEYHSRGRRGKIEVIPTKPCATQRDLSLAYSPGVAIPCLRIHDDPSLAYEYTARGNLVAVISNGTAVLGLGDIGALAGKPVMEGKGVLFKRFADIDVFDIELDTHDVEEFIRAVKLMEPTFGGINLEDIKAPQCFEIEQRLRAEMDIPVFHDDQHGTAIISGAALLNACEITGKRIDQIKVVFNGAGASGIACAKFYIALGVRPQNVTLCDTTGVIYAGRTKGMNPWKQEFARETDARTLADAMKGADVFCGLSVAGCVTQDMLRTMAERPVVFAMANPDPEITYDDAVEARPDVLMATGRSDYPNQVNNVLGFPFIFRGALDVRARTINEEMKLAAAHALAKLTREDVPESVTKAYGLDRLEFGPTYLIPKPFDHRVLIWEASAVAKAAMDTGVARLKVDLDEYRDRLESRLGKSRQVMRAVIHGAQREPKRVVFPEGADERVLRAAQILLDEGIAKPILLGRENEVRDEIARLQLDLAGAEIIHPASSPSYEKFAEELHRLRQRKGITPLEARATLRNATAFGAMMVRTGHADALVAGTTQHYPDTMRPALQIIGTAPGVKRVAGVFVLLFKDRTLILADTTVNIDPSAEDLAEIAMLSAEVARRFDVEPRVAMLSFSNFGSVRHPAAEKVRQAVAILKKKAPDLVVDGEMQADTAVSPEIAERHFPFSAIAGDATVLVFPELHSANMAYKLLAHLGGAEAIGPVLVGMAKPVHVLQHGMGVQDIVNVAAIAVVEAQGRAR